MIWASLKTTVMPPVGMKWISYKLPNKYIDKKVKPENFEETDAYKTILWPGLLFRSNWKAILWTAMKRFATFGTRS